MEIDPLNNWFVEEKIDDTTIAISEYGHFEEMHSYLLIGNEHALLIDTGLGIGNIRSVVDKYVNCDDLWIVTTHVHWDHIGGHRYFNKIFVNSIENNWLTGEFPLPLSFIK